mgnify:CR=1 FL=1
MRIFYFLIGQNFHVPPIRTGMRDTCMNTDEEFTEIKVMFYEIFIMFWIKFITKQIQDSDTKLEFKT